MIPNLPPMQPDIGRLTGLVFELAAQLHIERTGRLALETALERAGALAPGALTALADDAALLSRSRGELEASMRKLLRVLGDDPDPRTPLSGDVPTNPSST
ncbi:hypothetical protein [Niveispirillum sp. KHB5.9]|uniref:hypothetical protein n=1 Tax=Niveispirillum sp. KHB5.9 TaxID=3400269 RepID=UPI003A852698